MRVRQAPFRRARAKVLQPPKLIVRPRILTTISPVLQVEPTLQDVVQRRLNVSPDLWTGILNLHLGGKTGEILYASGIMPAIRKAVPKAKVALHIHQRYENVVTGLREDYRPDRVMFYASLKYNGYAKEVTGQLMVVGKAMRGQHWYIDAAKELHCFLYYAHYQDTHSKRPFYKQFSHKAGVQGIWEKPKWIGVPAPGLGDIALAFPTTNEHSGGPRLLEASPDLWASLAKDLRSQGLTPMATGHPDDGRPNMPGWEWQELGDPVHVLALLPHAQRVVGHNSGIIWSALLLSPGRVTMFNAQRPALNKLYGFTECDEVVDPSKHFQKSFYEYNPSRLAEALL